jgi:hypothetical protein
VQGGTKFLRNRFSRQANNGKNLVPRRSTSHDLHRTAGAFEDFSQELHKGFVRGGIDRWGGDFDFQFVAEHIADFVPRSARLDFGVEQHAVALHFQVRRQRHRELINRRRADAEYILESVAKLI